DDPVDVVTVHREVIQDGEQPDTVRTVLRADPVDHGERVGRGEQRVVRGTTDRFHQHRAAHSSRGLRRQREVLRGEFILTSGSHAVHTIAVQRVEAATPESFTDPDGDVDVVTELGTARGPG